MLRVCVLCKSFGVTRDKPHIAFCELGVWKQNLKLDTTHALREKLLRARFCNEYHLWSRTLRCQQRPRKYGFDAKEKKEDNAWPVPSLDSLLNVKDERSSKVKKPTEPK